VTRISVALALLMSLGSSDIGVRGSLSHHMPTRKRVQQWVPSDKATSLCFSLHTDYRLAVMYTSWFLKWPKASHMPENTCMKRIIMGLQILALME
jgi:hypothetical protein